MFGVYLNLKTLCSNSWPLPHEPLVQATDSNVEVSLLELIIEAWEWIRSSMENKRQTVEKRSNIKLWRILALSV